MSRVIGISQVQRNVLAVKTRFMANSQSQAGRVAGVLENDAKTHRPWTDRTGNARASITGSYNVTAAFMVIALAIGVDYGKYLELSNGGKYRIVWPTMLNHRVDFIKALQESFR